MLPRINTNTSPSSKLGSPTSKLFKPNEFNIQEKTMDLALLVIGLDKRSFNVLDSEDLIHYRITSPEQKLALEILLFYKKN